jgi:hypothetical protein
MFVCWVGRAALFPPASSSLPWPPGAPDVKDVERGGDGDAAGALLGGDDDGGRPAAPPRLPVMRDCGPEAAWAGGQDR